MCRSVPQIVVVSILTMASSHGRMPDPLRIPLLLPGRGRSAPSCLLLSRFPFETIVAHATTHGRSGPAPPASVARALTWRDGRDAKDACCGAQRVARPPRGPGLPTPRPRQGLSHHQRRRRTPRRRPRSYERVYGAGEAVVAHLGDLVTCGLVRRALVATIPRVVLSPTERQRPRGVAPPCRPACRLPGADRPAPSLVRGSLTSPKAFTAARAPTTRPPSRWAEALRAALHRAVHAEDLPHGRPCACPDAALGEVAARGR